MPTTRHDEAPRGCRRARPENYRHTLTCVAYRAAPLAAVLVAGGLA